MPEANCRSPYSSCPLSPHLNSPSALDNEMFNNVLNMSPKLAAYPDSIVKSENMLSSEASLKWNSENTVGCTSLVCTSSRGNPTLKSSDALRREIATLEAEILHLERHLLQLYRTAFEERPPATSNVPKNHFNLRPQIESSNLVYHDQTSPAHGWASSDDQSCTDSVHMTSTRDQKNAYSGRRSLADHLGASCLLDSLNTPDRLSEDILKCISSIYCRLANPTHSYGGLLSSPPSSLSSSSVFSSRNPCDNWSPQYSEDNIVHHQGLKQDGGPYAAMMEVLKICLDDDSFNYAAVMLKNFRKRYYPRIQLTDGIHLQGCPTLTISQKGVEKIAKLLVRNLEKVDPRKMKREEKLAFWINIHNALVMHAYLAYGNHNRVKSASILKAAYNIGGHCVNACVIQNSILGIRSHYSERWLQTLFSPGRKSKTGSSSHAYALEYPEPLVHFALCSGAYSDPAVQVYTAKNIFQELKLAKAEFIQSSVHIHKEAKIFLPKILCYFAKDTSIDMYALLKSISGCLTEAQRRAVSKCMKRKVDKHIHWIPQSSTFRYVIRGEFAKGG